MPLPFIPIILGAAALVAGGTGVVMGVNAKEKLDQAKSYQEKAQKLADHAKREGDKAQSLLKEKLNALGEAKLKLSNISKEVAKQLEQDEKEELNANNSDRMSYNFDFDSLYASSITVTDVALSSISALGAGTATCALALGGVVAFGAASTGTAISALSGAAFSSSVLAWLGGGAVAVGGLGALGGAAVLSGLFAGPALLIGGFVLSSKADDALNEARNYYDEIKRKADHADWVVSNIKTSIYNIDVCTTQAIRAADKLKQLLDIYRKNHKHNYYSFKSIMGSLLICNNVLMGNLPVFDPIENNQNDPHFVINPKFVRFSQILVQVLIEIDKLQQVLGSSSSYYPTNK